MDRRTTIKWVLAAAGAMAGRANPNAPGAPVRGGYGPDPDLIKVYKPGELWPLTLTGPQRDTARVLCDLIIPADPSSPSASEVGVVDFIDEWISAPYKQQRGDRAIVLEGRCHEREYVPYKGVDAIVDELAAHLDDDANEALGRCLEPLEPYLRQTKIERAREDRLPALIELIAASEPFQSK